MEISKKTDYALRMLAMLVREPDQVLSVRTAADENDVPYSFARAIQHDLVRAGIIESLRGSHGGMRLAIDPEKTTLLEVVVAVQGPITLGSCESMGPDGTICPRIGECHFNPIFCSACAILSEFFNSVTLADVVRGTKAPSLPERFWSADAFEPLKPAIAGDLA